MRSDAQLRRMLKLIPYLSRNQGVTLQEVAARFDTTPARVLADLEVLQFCGLPEGLTDDLFDVDLEGAREDGHIFFRNAEVLRQPMRMRRAEATSLLAALEAVVEVSGSSDAATEALTKLRSALGVQPEVEVELSAGDPEVVRELQQAIEEHQVVRLTHAGRDGVARPEVEPARIRAVGGYSYLDAWSRQRGAWRSYRLDRVSAVEALTETFAPRALPPDQDWFSDITEEVELTLRPRAAWVAEYHPVREVTTDDGLVRVTIPVASREWLVGLVLRLGDDLVDASDPGLLAEAAERADQALRAYQNTQ